MRLSLLACLLLWISACTPAHLQADGDGGFDGRDGEVPKVCGDSFVHQSTGEQCDDGNTESGDGCDEECQYEIPENCGNNVMDDGEGCDDGNNTAGDGCGPGCWIEGCGNSFLDPGEACEDSNTADGDGCAADCRSDESCGNAIKDEGEQCDDGDGDDGDECPRTCAPAICGDGFVRRGVESCDDGNQVADDGCSDCILDSCGDGNSDQGEECDLGAGNGMAGATCFKNCISTGLEPAQVFDRPVDLSETYATTPSFVTAADMNADGRMDLLVADDDSTVGSVIYGLGDGRFWPHEQVSPGYSGLQDLALVDVNGDSILDVLTVGSSNDVLVVQLGTDGGFEAPLSFTTVVDIGGDTPYALAVADATGDGVLDVVTANYASDDVTILQGDGAGSFEATVRLGVGAGTAGDQPREIAMGDVTGDGILDIVTVNFVSDDVAVLAGLGSGNYAAAEHFTTRAGAGGDGPVDLAVAEVTNDGVADVVVVSNLSDDIMVLAASGGGLAAPVRFSTLSGDSGEAPIALAVADVTQDGIPDIITANESNDVAILRGLGPGVAFGAATTMSTIVGGGNASGISPRDVAIGDVNGDAIPDIVTINFTSRDATVFVGEGSGDFAEPAVYEVADQYSSGAYRLALADINGDGTLDVTAMASSWVLRSAGLGDGRFTSGQWLGSAYSSRVDGADFNGDGRLDVLVGGSGYVHIYLQGVSGDFTRVDSAYHGLEVEYPAAGDVDSDGDVDVVFMTSNTFRVMLNDGNGYLTAGMSMTAGASAFQCVLADVTEDDEVDYVFAAGSSDQVYVATGNGAGSFSTPVGISTSESTSGRNPQFVEVGNVNDDPYPDMVTANFASNDVTVLLGTGSGSFADPIIVPTVFGADPASVLAARIGDFNGDGIPDVAAANRDRSSISIMIGFGDGQYAAPQTYDVGERPLSIAADDFDGDGIDDIAVVGSDSGRLTTLTGFQHP